MTFMRSSATPRGFVALLSVVLVSGLLLTVVLAAATRLSLGLSAVQAQVAYRTAQEHALSCAAMAFSRLSFDPGRFQDTATTTVLLENGSSCSIFAASTTSDGAQAHVGAHVDQSFVELFVVGQRSSAETQFVPMKWREY